MLKIKVNQKKEFEVDFTNKDNSEGKINNKDFKWDVYNVKNTCGCYHILKDKQSFNATVQEADIDEKKFVISVRGNAYQIEVKDRYDVLLKNLGLENAFVQKISEIKAPMPGLVLNILKKEGDEIAKGDSILVLEAMKMENVIKSPTDGIIKHITVKKGQAVEKNEILITFS